MSKFKVGDVVIFIDSDRAHHNLIGEECEVLRLLDSSVSSYPTPQFYEISLRDKNRYIGCAENCLRKKKKPEETSSWEEIQKLTNWNPQKVTA